VVSPLSGEGGSAREAALECLRRVDRGEVFLRDELHAIFDRLGLEPRDRALATQLATGVVRHRRTLRLVLSHVRGRSTQRLSTGGRGRQFEIQASLRRILELGAFQLLFLDRVPAYAAVNEAVRQAQAARRGAEKAGGFVNAMLRGVARLVRERRPDGRPAPDAIPHPEGGVVQLKEPILPDPKDGLAAFLGTAYSYPDWLVARWLTSFGPKEAEQVCRWSNRRPKTFARVNPPHAAARREPLGRATAHAGSAPFHEPLAPGFAGAEPGPRPGTYDVSPLPVERLEELLAAGALTVQDPSAMAPVEALAPQPGESVLDFCASPGTKTTQIVEAMADRGRIVACDRREEKLEPIRRTVAARGLASVTVCLSDEAASAAPPGGFDAALVDAPCSNTGVLARRVEARWRLRPEDLEELPRIQSVLLGRAAGLVRPGGRIVYATCSLQREENEEVVKAFLAANPSWRLVRSDLILPGPDHDGVFWALFRRA